MTAPKTLDDIYRLLDTRMNELHTELRAITDRVTHLEHHATANVASPPRTAGARLVAVPELLEHILLHLPMRDLLLAQRTNKQVKAVIDGSPSIQRALFFLPETPKAADAPSIPVLNPLLSQCASYKKIPLFGLDSPKFYADLMHPFDRDARSAAPVAPKQTLLLKPTDKPAFTVVLRLAEMPVSWRPESVALRCADYLQGSWGRMYLSQPPCEVAWANSSWDYIDLTSYHYHGVDTIRGLFQTVRRGMIVGEKGPWARVLKGAKKNERYEVVATGAS